MRFAIPVYIDKGKVIKTGEIEKIAVNKGAEKYIYALSVKSKGNSKIRVNGVSQIIQIIKLLQKYLLAVFPYRQIKQEL